MKGVYLVLVKLSPSSSNTHMMSANEGMVRRFHGDVNIAIGLIGEQRDLRQNMDVTH